MLKLHKRLAVLFASSVLVHRIVAQLLQPLIDRLSGLPWMRKRKFNSHSTQKGPLVFRKRKKPNRSLPKARTQHNAATLDSAGNYLRAGRFREAIAQFKELLKTTPNDPARTMGLAEAYAGRAEQLEAKGMLKEALVTWENRSLLEGTPISASHVSLLLRFGRIDEVLKYYCESATLAPEVNRTISPHLAAQNLGGATNLDQVLSDDDPVLAHGLAARKALAAYCAADDAALQQALAGIPFRSPYRDFVLILKALSNADRASELLAKVADNSAFATLRDAAQLALSPERSLPATLNESGRHTRELVFALRGWSPKRQALWLDLHKLGSPPSVKGLRALMQRHRQALGPDWVDHYDLRLQLAEERSGRSPFQFITNRQSELQTCRLEAMRAEIEQAPWEAAQAWGDVASLLHSGGVPEKYRGDKALFAAAALRRPENCFDVLSHATHKSDQDSLDELCVEMLESSLEYDPDDIDCHLRLIRYYRGTSQLKEARRILNKAQQRWPEDKAVLIEAMETALVGSAYKKAAGIAHDILKIDPINGRVRERLVNAHLAHARKQLKSNRPDLAEKSVAEATAWANSERARERVELAHGFVTLATNVELGKSELRAANDRLGDGLTARLALALEAEQDGHSIHRLLKKLDLYQVPKVEHRDLLTFFERMREHLDAGDALCSDIGDYLKKPLRQAARLDLDKAEAEAACESLRRADLHDSRAIFAKAALQRWRGEPVFEYHEIDARFVERGVWNMDDKDLDRLERAQDRARASGNMRLVERIHDTLSPFGVPLGIGAPGPFSEFAPDSLDGPVPPPVELLSELIRTVGVEHFLGLLKEDNEVGEALRELQHTLGKPAFRSMVERLSEEVDNEAFDPIGLDFQPFERPHSPKIKTTKRKKKPGPNDDAPDDEFPDQRDLFE